MGKAIIILIMALFCLTFVLAENVTIYDYKYNPYTAKQDRSVNLKYINDTIDARTSGTLFFFLWNDTSSQAGYKVMNTTITDGAQKTQTYASVTSGVLEKWVNVNTNLTFLRNGVGEFHIHIQQTSGTKTTTIFVNVTKRDYLNNEQQIAISENATLTGGVDEVFLHFSIPDVLLNVSDKIEVELNDRVSGAGTDPTIKIYTEGNTVSHLSLPATGASFSTSSSVDLSNVLRNSTAGQDEDAILHDLNITNNAYIGSNLSVNGIIGYMDNDFFGNPVFRPTIDIINGCYTSSYGFNIVCWGSSFVRMYTFMEVESIRSHFPGGNITSTSPIYAPNLCYSNGNNCTFPGTGSNLNITNNLNVVGTSTFNGNISAPNICYSNGTNCLLGTNYLLDRLYLTNLTSDIAGSIVLNSTGDGSFAFNIFNSVVDGQILKNWTTPINYPNRLAIPPGNFTFSIKATETVSAAKLTKLFVEIWEVNSSGSAIRMIGMTTNTTVPYGSIPYLQLNFSSLEPIYFSDLNSRITAVLKVSISGAGNTPGVAIYYGTGFAPTHGEFNISNGGNITQNSFVPFNNALFNLNLGTRNITANAYCNASECRPIDQWGGSSSGTDWSTLGNWTADRVGLNNFTMGNSSNITCSVSANKYICSVNLSISASSGGSDGTGGWINSSIQTNTSLIAYVNNSQVVTDKTIGSKTAGYATTAYNVDLSNGGTFKDSGGNFGSYGAFLMGVGDGTALWQNP